MVILAMLMLVTVPNVVGILSQNKKNAYSDDAGKMVSSAKYVISEYKNKGILILPSANGECTVMTMGFLDKSEFTKAPNDGKYDFDNSYVVIERVAGEKSGSMRYNYYVQLVETRNSKHSGVKVNSIENFDKTNFEVESISTLNNTTYGKAYSQAGKFNATDANIVKNVFAKSGSCFGGVISVYSAYEE